LLKAGNFCKFDAKKAIVFLRRDHINGFQNKKGGRKEKMFVVPNFSSAPFYLYLTDSSTDKIDCLISVSSLFT